MFEEKGKFFALLKEASHNQYKRQGIIATDSISLDHGWQRVTRITSPPCSIGLESPVLFQSD